MVAPPPPSVASRTDLPPWWLGRNGLKLRREQTNGFQSFRTRSIIKLMGKCPWCLKHSLFILMGPLNPNAWRFRPAFAEAAPAYAKPPLRRGEGGAAGRAQNFFSRRPLPFC